MFKKVNSLKDLSLEQLLFIFFNITETKGDLINVTLKLKSSKHSSKEFIKIDSFKKILNYLEVPGNHEEFSITFKFANENFENENFLLSKIYNEILKKIIIEDKEKVDKILINILFGIRGSVDLTGSYITVDILRKNQEREKKYLNNFIMLISQVVNNDYLNINFREAQKQFVEGDSKRNTQFRLRLFFFKENPEFLRNLFNINPYKADIIKDNLHSFKKPKPPTTSIFEKLSFYDSSAILKLPLTLKLQTDIPKRNQTIILLAKQFLPQICFGCEGKYRIEDRTFKMRDQNIYYLEVNHLIPFANGKNTDRFENLVHLCPACHRALSPLRADEKLQKEILKNIVDQAIIKEIEHIIDFAKSFLNETNIENDMLPDLIVPLLK
ncbi:MAG: HNH endonuclease [Metamycoplasmataceae bacterium]